MAQSTRSKQTKQTENIVLNHLQPQALELEEAVLGALMIEQDAYIEVSDILKAESFYDHRHRVIYSAVTSLYISQRPIDILTVTEQLKSTGQLEEAGGAVYIAMLAGKVTSSAHIEYHAQIIAQKAIAREIISYSGELQTKAFDSTTDVSELLQEAEGQLFQITHRNVKKDFSSIDSVLADAMTRIKTAASRAKGMSGLASGFKALDDVTSGWQKSDLIILAARPAMGKTAFALSMAKNIAVNNNTPVAVFSLEMSNVQLVNRLISSVCEIPGHKLRDGRLAPYEWNILDQKVSALQNAPIYLDDTPSLSITEFRSKAFRLKSEHDIQLIIIDYLQLMNASGIKFGNRQEEISTISRNLKAIAKELDIPIIALSQLNRSVDSREGGYEGKRPQLNDLRESGAIEQDADIVCFIHRPEYYKIYEDPQHNDLHGVAEIIIAKHRNGGVGDVRLAFRSELALFDNLGAKSIQSRVNQPQQPTDDKKEEDLENDPLGANTHPLMDI
ncbi:MAG: replicative DNA helicase [Bacteroidaceae bacterium]|nr:replicative DNA helicase [Bacteroidaceae bacterium]